MGGTNKLVGVDPVALELCPSDSLVVCLVGGSLDDDVSIPLGGRLPAILDPVGGTKRLTGVVEEAREDSGFDELVPLDVCVSCREGSRLLDPEARTTSLKLGGGAPVAGSTGTPNLIRL